MNFEEQLFGEEQLKIDNTQNVEAQCVENMPETGPYVIRFRDILLEQALLEELFASIEVPTTSIQGKTYETKTGESVYTYYVETDDREAAIRLLALNNKKYQGALLNTHFCRPRREGERRTYDRKAFEFSKDQMGTQQQSVEPQYNSFSREQMGSNKQEQQNSVFSFTRDNMGQNKQQSSTNDGEFKFTRSQMGQKKQAYPDHENKTNVGKQFADARSKKTDSVNMDFQ